MTKHRWRLDTRPLAHYPQASSREDVVNHQSDHGYPVMSQRCAACGSVELYCCDGNGKRLSRAQRGLLKDIAHWGEVGPDAEDAAGCHGAAFGAVLHSLIEMGYVAGDGRYIADLK